METNFQAEEFRAIPGFAAYEVSNHGRVRNSKTKRLLSSFTMPTNYKVVGLQNNRIRKQHGVHRLVMLAFVGQCPPDQTVDHIDRVRSNNVLTNLRYATTQEQHANRFYPEVLKSARQVERVRGTETVFYKSVSTAAKDTNSPTISIYVAINKSRVYKGYQWRYVTNASVMANWLDISPALIGGRSGYAASDSGLIKFPDGRITPGSLGNDGYYRVGIANGNQYVHRLVAATFLQPPSADDMVVNHVDGNKSNNSVQNLEWVTRAENTAHAHRIGLVAQKMYAVKQYKISGEFVEEFANAYIAGRSLEKEPTAIHRCCRGESKTAYGFTWKYSGS